MKDDKKKQRQVKHPKTLKKIRNNAAIKNNYKETLKKLTLKIHKSALWWGMASLNQNANKNISKQLTFTFNELLSKWNKNTKKIAKALSKKTTRNVERYVNLNLKSQDPSLDAKFKSKLVKNELAAIYEQNFNLIKNLPEGIINKYRQFFLNNVNTFSREKMLQFAKEHITSDNKRAEFIARDQTQKAINGYTQARAQQLGFEYYQWLTAGDGRVSSGYGGHRVLNNRIYKYAEPTAIIDSNGTKGKPSERPNCRCVAVSVVLANDEEVKLVKDSEAGDYYIIVKKE